MTIKAMCAIVFIAFCFLWLYFFQSDILFITQHLLSGGQTHYNKLVGALLITSLLWLIQLVVYKLTGLRKRSHALTWFPSMLLLAILTSLTPKEDGCFDVSFWLWLIPLSMLLWGGGVWVAHVYQPYEPVARKLLLRNLWSNLLMMALMMAGVAACSDTRAVYHYRAHAEMALLNGNLDEALRVGNRSLETDESLMMLRMYALSRQGKLADRLFEYPIVPSSEAILPTASKSRMMVYPTDSLYRHLGAIPRRSMKPMDYLQTIIRSGQAKEAAVDYLLCGYLIDRDLDSFARSISHYYTVNDSLPRYYREALVLYTHKRSQPVVIYHDAVLDVDYNDMLKMESACGSESERKGKALENYADSYWYYYKYVSR